MKIIKSLIVALLLLGCAGNEVLGMESSEILEMESSEENNIEKLNEPKNSPHKEISSKIAADIAANVVIYRLLPLSVTKWSYHFLFMDFYAGYTMLGVTLLSPKFLTFCKGKLRIGFIDISLDFWRLIPLAMTHRFCRKFYNMKQAVRFYGFNVLDVYFLYIQWKMVKISWLNCISTFCCSQIFDDEGKPCPHILYTCDCFFPFFFADGYEDNFYYKNSFPILLLLWIPKISLNFSWNKDHENEQTENDIE